MIQLTYFQQTTSQGPLYSLNCDKTTIMFELQEIIEKYPYNISEFRRDKIYGKKRQMRTGEFPWSNQFYF